MNKTRIREYGSQKGNFEAVPWGFIYNHHGSRISSIPHEIFENMAADCRIAVTSLSFVIRFISKMPIQYEIGFVPLANVIMFGQYFAKDCGP